MELFRPVHISGYAREAHDFYPTPDWVTACLLRHVRLRGQVWEPCCGDGAIARMLQAHQYPVVASDAEDRGFGTAGVDVFACDAFPPGCGALVTNPPYGDGGASRKATNASSGMLRFVRHALDLSMAANGQLALLVRFQWMAGKRAAAMLGGALPPWPSLLMAGLYSLGAHGIMTLNDFKSVDGDKKSGVASLPVQLGVSRAAKLACYVMAVPQMIVCLLLLHWDHLYYAIAVAVLLAAQGALMPRLLFLKRHAEPPA